jgi:phospholipid/cholesterol/gamma-HCH transport system permease protein
MVKAPVFAYFIALIGCRRGLSVEKNARSVGLNTTATVVESIVLVILLDAFFAVLFMEMGI